MIRVTLLATVSLVVLGGCGASNDGSAHGNDTPDGAHSSEVASADDSSPGLETPQGPDVSSQADGPTAGGGPEAAAADAANESGTGEAGGTGGQVDAVSDTPQPKCGAKERYTVLTGADSGLVKDNTTMLTWMTTSYDPGEPPGQKLADAKTYCSNKKMRVPTRDEAMGISGSNYAMCAFGHWGTFTTTPYPAGCTSSAGCVWFLYYSGNDSYQAIVDNYNGGVLCVK